MRRRHDAPRSQETRIAQLERDITRAVNRLLEEFTAETGMSPHAIDLELMRESYGSDEAPVYTATHARVHLED